MIKIGFNKKLYSKTAIKSAIGAYKNLADFKIKEEKKYIRVVINNIDGGIKSIIKDEFCNYTLYSLRR